ncbi:MAG: TonB family protein [Croceibacterium sp.]
MAVRLLENRGRAIGVAGTIAVHVVVIGLLLWLAPGPSPLRQTPAATLVSVDVRALPPPPPPDKQPAVAAAPPSRGRTAAPAPAPRPRPLPKPITAQPSIDPGASTAAGLGAAPGSGAGQRGEGSGSGSRAGGSGRGSGVFTPPVQIAGALTNSDYRGARAPRGAAGMVRVSFRVRSDGAADQCRVTGSSGYAEFDDTTCRLIEQRFRFRPATGDQGQAIDWMAHTDYTWAPR